MKRDDLIKELERKIDICNEVAEAIGEMNLPRELSVELESARKKIEISYWTEWKRLVAERKKDRMNSVRTAVK